MSTLKFLYMPSSPAHSRILSKSGYCPQQYVNAALHGGNCIVHVNKVNRLLCLMLFDFSAALETEVLLFETLLILSLFGTITLLVLWLSTHVTLSEERY